MFDIFVPGVKIVKRVVSSVPSVGSTSGVAVLQSVAHVTMSPAATVPVKVMSVAEAAAEWDLFFYNKLGDMALSGLFSELGSPNYWYRTYPAIINLADFGSPRVRLT